jgi:hypothetical protein
MPDEPSVPLVGRSSVTNRIDFDIPGRVAYIEYRDNEWWAYESNDGDGAVWIASFPTWQQAADALRQEISDLLPEGRSGYLVEPEYWQDGTTEIRIPQPKRAPWFKRWWRALMHQVTKT